MKRHSQVVGVLLLMAGVATCAQSTAEPKPAKAPKAPPPPRKELRPNAGTKAPKGGGAPRLGNPGNPVERLMAMPPEKREQVLEKLPPKQQENLRQRLDRFPGLVKICIRPFVDNGTVFY